MVTCHWEHFFTHFAQVSMTVQGLSQETQLLVTMRRSRSVHCLVKRRFFFFVYLIVFNKLYASF